MANGFKYDFTGLMDKPKKKLPTEPLPTTTGGVYLKGVEERTREAEQRIKERGTLWGNIKQDIASGQPGRVAMGGLSIAGSPITTLEHTLANPMLAMQRGEFGIPTLAKEAYAGLTGRRRGEYGDVLKIGGMMPEKMAETVGLGAAIAAPTKIINVALKPLQKISKWSDKGIRKAGGALVKATDDATNFVWGKLKTAFGKVDDVDIDQGKFIDIISKLPKPLVEVIEETVGRLTDFSRMTIGQLRGIKRIIGKYRPGVFGKGERGLTETIEAHKINKSYALIKGLLEDTLNSSIGKTGAQKLMKIEETMTNAIRAASVIKKAVIDPTLRMATRGGRVARGIAKEGDITTRTALTILRKGGKEAMKNVDEAIRLLNSFNRWQMVSKLGRYVGRAAIIGGAVRAALPRKTGEGAEATPPQTGGGGT